MSLLNEMLKDLSENKSRVKASPIFIPQPGHTKSKKLLKIVPWVLGIFIASLLILFILKGIGVAPQKTKNVMPKAVTTQLTTPLNSAIAAINFKSAVIQASPVAEKSEQAQMTLISSLPSIAEFAAEAQQIKSAIIDNEDINETQKIKKKSINGIKVLSELTDNQWHDYYLNKALAAIQDGDDYKAINLLEKVLVRFPSSVAASESLAALYMANGQLGLAQKTLDDGLSFKPNAFGLSTMKARLLFEQDRAKEALEILTKFKPDIYRNPDFYGLLAAVYQTLGRDKEAGGLYQKLVEIVPSNGQYWLGYAIALEQRNANQQAVSAYKRASQSYDIDPAVRVYAESRLKLLQG